MRELDWPQIDGDQRIAGKEIDFGLGEGRFITLISFPEPGEGERLGFRDRRGKGKKSGDPGGNPPGAYSREGCHLFLS